MKSLSGLLCQNTWPRGRAPASKPWMNWEWAQSRKNPLWMSIWPDEDLAGVGKRFSSNTNTWFYGSRFPFSFLFPPAYAQVNISREDDDAKTCNRLLLLFWDVWQWWIFEWIRNITSETKLFVLHRLYLMTEYIDYRRPIIFFFLLDTFAELHLHIFLLFSYQKSIWKSLFISLFSPKTKSFWRKRD